VPAPGGKVSWLRQGRNLWNFSPSYATKKLVLFSHHPIFLHPSLQHTGYAPLFTQLTNEAPHFAPPFTNCTTKISIFPSSLLNICPNFRELLWEALKILVWSPILRPPLALRPGTTVPPAPSLRHCLSRALIVWWMLAGLPTKAVGTAVSTRSGTTRSGTTRTPKFMRFLQHRLHL